MRIRAILFLSVLTIVSCSSDGQGDGSGSTTDEAGTDGGDDGPVADTVVTSDQSSDVCPAGLVGDSCDLCTFAGQGEECQPTSPRDVFDLEVIQALTIADLEFELTNTVEADWGTVAVGDWNGGLFPAIDADGEHVDQTIRSRAAIYVPAGWPNTANADRALVYGVHYESNVRSGVAANIAASYGMLVLYHGEYRSNWSQLGYPGRGDLNSASGANINAINPCLPVDLRRGNYQFYSIPQTDMRAITLVQRLAEARGGEVREVALRGFSKEGGGAWTAIAVDDRITVAAPGGYPIQDRMATSQTWIDTFGCEGEEDGNARARRANDSRAWSLGTPAGAANWNAFDISLNQDLFFPSALIIDGDVHLPGMHDGKYFPLGSETPFLDSLALNHRYVRKATIDADSLADGGDLASTTAVPVLLAELLVEGADTLDTYYPKVAGADTSIQSGTLHVEATIEGPVEHVLLWWSWSDDRAWSEDGQAEWLPVELTYSVGTWTGEVDLDAQNLADKVIGWYVEAQNTMVLGDNEYSRLDASPVRFLQLPEPGTCEPSTEVFCEGI